MAAKVVAGLLVLVAFAVFAMKSAGLWKIGTPPVIEVPVQASRSGLPAGERSDAAEAGLRRLTSELGSHGTDPSEAGALQSLPIAALDRFMQAALADSVEFFSADTEAGAMAVAAIWLERQRASVVRSRARNACMRLRWSVPRINEVVDVCSMVIRRSCWILFCTSASTSPLHVVRIDQPGRALARANESYRSNPYSSRRLQALILALAREGHRDVAERLLHEMLQFDVEQVSRLEHELATKAPARQRRG